MRVRRVKGNEIPEHVMADVSDLIHNFFEASKGYNILVATLAFQVLINSLMDNLPDELSRKEFADLMSQSMAHNLKRFNEKE